MGFSLGLILVVVAGAGMCTGNNLIVMSAVSGRSPIRRLLANWGVGYLGYAIGALSVVIMVVVAEWWRQDDLGVGAVALTTAAVKTVQVIPASCSPTSGGWTPRTCERVRPGTYSRSSSRS